MRKFILAVFSFLWLTTSATDPMATNYSFRQCEGSLTPYPTEINPAVYPDSLEVVYISHVGRHGSRYPASATNCLKLQKALNKADSLGTITPTGRRLAKLNEYIIARSDNQWGALDSLGIAEQRSIASRMMYNFKTLFSDGAMVNAISSYSPRAMMSMNTFVHQMDRMNNRLNFTTSTGRFNSYLVRPFDTDESYKEFINNKIWQPAYNDFFNTNCPTTAITRALGERYPFVDENEAKDLAITEYYVIAGCQAMGIDPSASEYFTKDEYNALWSCFNLRQYLQRTATTVSVVPADIAVELLRDIIKLTDEFIDGTNTAVVNLRFGHAETLMPLLSLMRLRGCYYVTNYFDTVAQHWRDFNVVPMSANLQFILFKAKESGKYYIRVDHNEIPTPLQPNSTVIYTPWNEARKYLQACIPLYIL